MKKIAFLVPPVTMAELFGEFGDAGNVLPFIGLMLLASLTRKHGYHTTLIDSMALKLSCGDVIDILKKGKYDYVGITATIQTADMAANVAELIKKELPNCRVILGGPHVTALPEKTLDRHPCFDVGVIGEGEETLLELLNFYDTGREDLDKIRGIVYRNTDGKAVRTGTRPHINDLDSYPMPAWDLLPDLKAYYRPAANNMNRLPAVNMMVSRGCPMMCTYCFNRMDPRNRIVRWYSVDRIMSEIEMLVNNFGVKEISFFDDNLLANKKHLIELCNRLIERKFDLTWTCYGSANLADEALFKLMSKAGCWQIAWGVEHGRQDILDVYNKRITVGRMREAMHMAKQAGLHNRAFIMHGNFLETKETIEDNIRYLKSLPADDFHATYFMPFPGTIVYEQVKDYGVWLKDPEIWSNYRSYQSPIFLPRGLTAQEVIDSYNRMYREFYFRPKIFIYYFKKMARNPSTLKPLLKTAVRFLKVFK